MPRGLSAEEAALWQKVAQTVTRLEPVRPQTPEMRAVAAPVPAPVPALSPRKAGRVPPPRPVILPPPPPRPAPGHGLDASWDRRLARGTVSPDVTIDLHGMTLDAAHGRLVGGIGQALAMGARVVLLIAGKQRPHDHHDLRGQRRGAIRAKLLDWLAHSPHAGRIAAVRPAAQRHGGAGAVYIVLRKER